MLKNADFTLTLNRQKFRKNLRLHHTLRPEKRTPSRVHQWFNDVCVGDGLAVSFGDFEGLVERRDYD